MNRGAHHRIDKRTYMRDYMRSYRGALRPVKDLGPQRRADRLITIIEPADSSVPRWTHYGRWTPDGFFVINNHGQEIYSCR